MCDRPTLVRRHHVSSASEIPSKQLLRADEALCKQERVMATFRGYAGDTARKLDNLVLSKYGIESEEPCKIHVCDECYRSLARNKLPDAALANGFWVGTLPGELQKATFVERAAAYPIRTRRGFFTSRHYRGVSFMSHSCLLCLPPSTSCV